MAKGVLRGAIVEGLSAVLYVSHCSLLIGHCSLLIGHCSLLIAHCRSFVMQHVCFKASVLDICLWSIPVLESEPSVSNVLVLNVQMLSRTSQC